MKTKSEAVNIGQRARLLLIIGPAFLFAGFAFVTTLELSSDPHFMMPVRHESNLESSRKLPEVDEFDVGNCFEFNTKEWIEARRLGNINMNTSVEEERISMQLILSPTLENSIDFFQSFQPVLERSLCDKTSAFVSGSPSESSDSKKWLARLLYLYIHHHQHRHARPEAQKLSHRCLSERKKAAIGRFDFQCRNARFLVVRFFNNGIGANMRYIAVPALMAGLATDRVVLFVNNSPAGPAFLQQPWTQVNCKRQDAQCFFLPASPCVLTHQELSNAYSLKKNERRQLFRTGLLPKERSSDRVLAMQLPFRPQRTPENLKGVLFNNTVALVTNYVQQTHQQQTLFSISQRILTDDERTVSDGNFSYYGQGSSLFHAILLYCLRPNPASATRMQRIIADSLPSDFDSNHGMGLPIRASDKCETEMECMPVLHHLNAARSIWGDVGQERNPFLVITSESETVKTEVEKHHTSAKNSFNSQLVFNSHDISQGTGFFHEPLLTADETSTILSAMSSLKLQLTTKMTLGNCCSNFHLLMKDILAEGCGVVTDHKFTCLQQHPIPRFRACCRWDKSTECQLRREQNSSNLMLSRG